jgi:hypothetical protein
MAALVVASIALSGLTPAYVAAAAGGDTFANDGDTYLHVKNAGAGACNVAVDSVALCSQGFDHNVAVAVPAGQERIIGPFAPARFGAICAVTYDQVVTVTVQAVRLPPS